MHVNGTLFMLQTIDSACTFQEQNFTIIIMHNVKKPFIITFKDVRDYAFRWLKAPND